MSTTPPRAPEKHAPSGHVDLTVPTRPEGDATPAEREAYESELKATAAFNNLSMSTAAQLGTDDATIGKNRTAFLFTLSGLVVVTGLILVLVVAFDGKNLAAVIASGASFLATVIVGLIKNPLLTIERDLVFRRWSDTIRTTFLVTLGHSTASPAMVQRAGEKAAAQFTVLAATYSAFIQKDAQAFAAVASLAGGPVTASSVSITNPGPQTGAKDKKPDRPLTIAVTGPSDLKLTCAGEPDGMQFDPGTGRFSGAPTTAKTYTGVVTASSAAQPDTETSVSFPWTITGA